MTRHLLAPGLRAVPRGRTAVQVGLDPQSRVVIERTPDNRSALEALVNGEPFEIDELAERSIDREAWLRQTTTPGLAARAAAHPSDWSSDTISVAIVGDFPGDATPLLRASGVQHSDPADADVVVHAWTGEVDRALLDPLMREGRPHVVLRYVDAGLVVGPFVVPGRSACLRCIDAHLAAADPLHPLIAARYAQATARRRPDGVPDPEEPALVQLGWALVARELTAWAHDDLPATYSRTMTFGPRAGAPRLAEWRRHPRCSCAWATMAT